MFAGGDSRPSNTVWAADHNKVTFCESLFVLGYCPPSKHPERRICPRSCPWKPFSLDGGNSRFSNRVLVETYWGLQSTIFAGISEPQKLPWLSTITKARLKLESCFPQIYLFESLILSWILIFTQGEEAIMTRPSSVLSGLWPFVPWCDFSLIGYSFLTSCFTTI